jgi:hypothetical protein
MIRIYKLINSQNVNLFDPIQTVFANKGINKEDMNWFLSPTPVSHDATLILNMNRGVDSLLAHIQEDNQIEILVDGDA